MEHLSYRCFVKAAGPTKVESRRGHRSIGHLAQSPTSIDNPQRAPTSKRSGACAAWKPPQTLMAEMQSILLR